ncbi:UNKNOWN [Stylonychia lemnae]|uniref:Uncharacterized protein n=1 Tax=Stylonychia lemnae TaxID=5949 RepID=A0A078AJL9_STYLE|nr:UNKNOWN [Stylonychia lemnae]|eukprot:CDW82086.1 UNKNOWN [Stylonychia lemnae]
MINQLYSLIKNHLRLEENTDEVYAPKSQEKFQDSEIRREKVGKYFNKLPYGLSFDAANKPQKIAQSEDEQFDQIVVYENSKTNKQGEAKHGLHNSNSLIEGQTILKNDRFTINKYSFMNEKSLEEFIQCTQENNLLLVVMVDEKHQILYLRESISTKSGKQDQRKVMEVKYFWRYFINSILKLTQYTRHDKQNLQIRDKAYYICAQEYILQKQVKQWHINAQTRQKESIVHGEKYTTSTFSDFTLNRIVVTLITVNSPILLKLNQIDGNLVMSTNINNICDARSVFGATLIISSLNFNRNGTDPTNQLSHFNLQFVQSFSKDLGVGIIAFTFQYKDPHSNQIKMQQTELDLETGVLRDRIDKMLMLRLTFAMQLSLTQSFPSLIRDSSIAHSVENFRQQDQA